MQLKCITEYVLHFNIFDTLCHQMPRFEFDTQMVDELLQANILSQLEVIEMALKITWNCSLRVLELRDSYNMECL